VGDYRVKDGLLVINPDLYAVLQTDVDAAGLKLMNFARTLRKLQSNPDLQADAVTKHEKDSGVPALRNAGLMLVHRRRALLLSNSFTANQQKNLAIQNTFANNAVPGPDLFTEDLIRGWRLDIWDDKTTLWRSLCERHSTYTVGAPSRSMTIAKVLCASPPLKPPMETTRIWFTCTKPWSPGLAGVWWRRNRAGPSIKTTRAKMRMSKFRPA